MPFTHAGFLLDEDEALKALLTGMTVSDERMADRPVLVRFGYGEPELTGDTPGAQITWPFVTIALLDVREETDRAERGRVQFAYPVGSSTAVDNTVDAHLAEWPIPVGIDYEITTHARSARHDRQILANIIGQAFPFRYGSLDVDDGTVRRLDVLSGPESADWIDGHGKREFRKVWAVRVSSELPGSQVALVRRATETNLTVIDLTLRQDRVLTQTDSAVGVESEVVS